MSGRRTNDTCTHTVLSHLGDELQARADHGAVYVELRQRGTRYPATIRLTVEQVTAFFGRGVEIAAIAPSTRRSA